MLESFRFEFFSEIFGLRKLWYYDQIQYVTAGSMAQYPGLSFKSYKRKSPPGDQATAQRALSANVSIRETRVHFDDGSPVTDAPDGDDFCKQTSKHLTFENSEWVKVCLQMGT